MQMSKNVNNDVSKDPPILPAALFGFAKNTTVLQSKLELELELEGKLDGSGFPTFKI